MMNSRRGSVLMEFVIVLPIYFLMLGFVFVTGELALHSIQLAGGADRSLALSEYAYEAFKRSATPDKDPDLTDPVLSYKSDDGGSSAVSEYHEKRIEWSWNSWNPVFKGPWTKVVAATVSDYYTLTPVTRGFVAFWYRDNRQKVEDHGGDILEGSALDEMIKDSGVIGRVSTNDGMGMTGRDRDDTDSRQFGYYTLVRNPATLNSGYRAWPAGALVKDNNWKECVAEEKYLEDDPEDPSDRSDLRMISESVTANAPPENADDVNFYPLNEDLKKWAR